MHNSDNTHNMHHRNNRRIFFPLYEKVTFVVAATPGLKTLTNRWGSGEVIKSTPFQNHRGTNMLNGNRCCVRFCYSLVKSLQKLKGGISKFPGKRLTIVSYRPNQVLREKVLGKEVGGVEGTCDALRVACHVLCGTGDVVSGPCDVVPGTCDVLRGTCDVLRGTCDVLRGTCDVPRRTLVWRGPPDAGLAWCAGRWSGVVRRTLVDVVWCGAPDAGLTWFAGRWSDVVRRRLVWRGAPDADLAYARLCANIDLYSYLSDLRLIEL